MNRVVFVIFAFLLSFAATQGHAGGPDSVTGEFIRVWQVCGPFDAEAVIPSVVENEESINPMSHRILNGREWKLLKSPDGLINLESEDAFGHINKAVGFAYAEIEAAADGDVILGVGSDDSVVVWWNGRQVLVQDVLRGTTIGEDQIRLRMKKGPNRLLLKVFDDGGGFGFATDLRSAAGQDIAWRVCVPLSDDELLDLVEQKAFMFFWKEANPDTGLIADAAPATGENTAPCSVASLGFGLTAYCIGIDRGWVTPEQARDRVVKALRLMLERADTERGFFYHFIDMESGKRAWNSELSSIDTALFLAGALTCRSYFDDPEITEVVDRLYRRVDWQWMLNGEDTFSMGWMPEEGFITYRWDSYSEHMLLYLLAMGAPAQAVPAELWHTWKRPYYTFEGSTYLQAVPLFLHQYTHCWVDFRDKRDAYADYFKNSALATKAHRAFCMSLTERFPHYSENLWGLTASKGPDRYMVWGGPPATLEYPIDGSVVPCSAGGSVMFTPEISMSLMRNLYENHNDAVWGEYGFLDAFNPGTGWTADGYIGIDVGATLLAIENLRSGKVWEWFMQGEEVQKAMEMAGFKSTASKLDKSDEEYLHKLADDTWACISHFVHPETQLPYDSSTKPKHTSTTNIGLYLTALGVAREMGFISSEEASRRADLLVQTIEKLPTWKGFVRCWHGVDDLVPAAHDPLMSLVDSANMCLGLTAAQYAFPELKERCEALLAARDWSALYNAEGNQLYGVFNMAAMKLNPDWRVDKLATDARAAAIMAIASGKVPAKVWDDLERDTTERYHARYLKPGWVGGGLFMQYLTGIFLDEKDALVGRSGANLAYANMRHADEIGSEVWGWSSCLDPAGGYIGWGKLRDEVVTPYASALAIEDYPKEVFENLVKLQQMGARVEWDDGEQEHAFGFRDSINTETREVADDYLVLNQAMLFLSLGNYLQDGIVRKWFHSDPKVQAAVAVVAELATPEGGDHVSVYEPGLGGITPKPQVLREAQVPRLEDKIAVDGDLSDWPELVGDSGLLLERFPENAEFGIAPNENRFSARIRLAWDAEYLYLGVLVEEDDLVTEAVSKELYKDDCIELFADPGRDGLAWGHLEDFQIGFAPSGPDGEAHAYAWFQDRVPDGLLLGATTESTPEGDGYVLEIGLPWVFLGVTDVEVGRRIAGSVAVHTVDKARENSAKINWSYVSDVDIIRLGEWELVE